MDRLIRDRLEDYLRGSLDEASVREFEARLAGDPATREAVERMHRQSALLRSLRAPSPVEPSPGFYARLMDRIERQRKPDLWTLLLDPAFGKRLVYATLTLLIMMGTYLVTTEPVSEVAMSSPERILAEASPAPETPFDEAEDYERDREAVLVHFVSAPGE